MENKTIPISEEDIKQFDKLNSEFDELALRLGNLGMRKMEIEHNEYQLSNIYSDLNLKQQALVQKYIDEYGNGGIDLNNKIFIVNE